MNQRMMLNALVDLTHENGVLVRRMDKKTSSHYLTKEAHDFIRDNKDSIEMLAHGMLRMGVTVEVQR